MDVVHVFLVLRGVGHVHDESSMPAVNVILASKQRGGFVQQGRGDSRKVLRQAVNLLVQIRIYQVKNAATDEHIRLCGHAVLHEPVGIQIYSPAGVFCQRRLQRMNTAEAVSAFLQIGVTKLQIVLYEAAECLLAQQRMRD